MNKLTAIAISATMSFFAINVAEADPGQAVDDGRNFIQNDARTLDALLKNTPQSSGQNDSNTGKGKVTIRIEQALQQLTKK